jgi:hypothetical protein
MKNVSELYNIYPGSDIYVVGTGTSFRVFPLSFLEGKITIGLNMAWKLLPLKYCITMVPHLNCPEFMGEKVLPGMTWVTKYDKYRSHATLDQLGYAEASYYFFRTDGKASFTLLDQPSEGGRVLDWVRYPTDNFLYLWTSISQSAVNLAANMGAKNIILVGCDNCALADNHHAHEQHTYWKGADPNIRYMQYYEGLAEMRSVLLGRGINLVSVSPFLKLDQPAMDFEKLCMEQGKPKSVHGHDLTLRSSIRDDNVRLARLAFHVMVRNCRAVKSRMVSLLRGQHSDASG